jgi:hypothetical protein
MEKLRKVGDLVFPRREGGSLTVHRLLILVVG